MTVYASYKNNLFICDQCSFEYHSSERNKSSYNTVVCQSCFDGAYDLRNHPQNKPPPVYPDPQAVLDPRPDVDLDPNAAQDDMEIPLYVGQTPA